MFHDVMVWTKLSMARIVLASVIKKKKDLTDSQFFFWFSRVLDSFIVFAHP